MLTEKRARVLESYVSASPHRRRSPTDQAAYPSLLRRLVAATALSREAVHRTILAGETSKSQSVELVYYALKAEGFSFGDALTLYRDRRAQLAGAPSEASKLKALETLAAGGKLARGEPISHRERRYLEHARLVGINEAAIAPLGRTGVGDLPTLRAWVLTWVETKQENAPESHNPEAPKTLTLTETKQPMQHNPNENSSNLEEAISLRLSPFGAVAISSRGKRPIWAGGETQAEALSSCQDATDTRERSDGKWVAWRAYQSPGDGGYALTGHELVCFDLDVKEGKDGMADLQSLSDKHGAPPETFITSTPSGGFHVYFRVHIELGARIKNGKLGGFSSIDVRACGGFLAEIGEGRKVLADHPVAFLPEGWGEALPLRDVAREPTTTGGRIEAVHRAADAAAAFAAACKEYAPAVQGSDGHKKIFALAMYARDLGLPPAESEPIAWEHYNPRCVPPWVEPQYRDFARQFESAWDRTDAKAGAPGQAALELERWPDFSDFAPAALTHAKASLATEHEATEAWLAERLASEHGSSLRFAGGQWRAWSGTLWVGGPEGDARAFAAVARTARGVLKVAADCPDEERKRLSRCAEQALTHRGAVAVLALAQHLSPLRAREDDFDGDPLLLAVANGTLDLRKLAALPRFADGSADLRALESLPHAPERMCSQLADVEFDPLAPRERWDAYLNWALPGQDDTNRFLQTWAGYCLTGLVEAQVFVNLHGPPGSGKSTFLSCFRAMMGDYGVTLSPSAVVYREEETAFSLDALAKVRKKRFAIIPELPGRKRLDVQRIKALTGDGVNVAKELYRGNVEYHSTAKLMFASNDHMVVDRDANDGFWRRLLLLLMCQPALKSGQPGYAKDWLTRIEAERSGLLNWALEGLHRYLSEGLVAPASVQQAVHEYQRSEDALGEFCEENLEYDADAFTTFASVRERYVRSRGPRFAKPTSRAFNTQLLAALPSRLGPESAQEKPKRAEGRGLPVRWKDDNAGAVPFDSFVAGLSPQPAR